jgi:hypothetical protein
MLNWLKDRGSPPSPPNHEVLVKAIAARAQQQVSWEQIQAYLRNRDLSPDQLAQWMTKYGGALVRERDLAVGEGLVQLSQIAEGELAIIARVLGEAMVGPSPGAEANGEAGALAQVTEAADQNHQPPTAVDPSPADPEVLGQVQAYLRGDFSFADPEGPGPSLF